MTVSRIFICSFHPKAEFVSVPDWYTGVEYTEEQKRGYEHSEDLFAPGFFEVTASKGDVLVFSASTNEERPAGFKAKFTKTVASKIPRSNFGNSLRNASQQFIEKRGGETNIVAGYPWFGSRVRDTFISLPGLALARKTEDLYAAVLDTQVRRMKEGMFPDKGNNDNPAFNSADSALWFFQALYSYGIDGRETWKRYGESMKNILQAYRDGALDRNTTEGKRAHLCRCSRQGADMDGCCRQRPACHSAQRLCSGDRSSVVQRSMLFT